MGQRSEYGQGLDFVITHRVRTLVSRSNGIGSSLPMPSALFEFCTFLREQVWFSPEHRTIALHCLFSAFALA